MITVPNASSNLDLQEVFESSFSLKPQIGFLCNSFPLGDKTLEKIHGTIHTNLHSEREK